MKDSHKPQPTETSDGLSRRKFVVGSASLSTLAATTAMVQETSAEQPAAETTNEGSDVRGGRLNQGVCMWCFDKFMTLDEMCVEAKKLGMVGIDLMGPKEFPTLKKHGLVCTMVKSHSLTDGFCDPKFHSVAIDETKASIQDAADHGYKNVICFSGNGRGIDRETGMKNCVNALNELTPLAEEKGVTLQMELLNSKVNHADYMCDNSVWGVELVKRVGSDRFKLLYDIYHMQIMEGDIIRTIEANHQYYGHYHTAGNPGRHEMDETQELYYPPIARAIADTGYQGYFSHEFIPVNDPRTSLAQAVAMCTV